MAVPIVSAGPRRPRVVIVGGGFAGLAAVRALRRADAEVLLVDEDAYSTFQPLLYQVATGGLNPGDITYSLRAVSSRVANARFRRLRVTGLDPAGHRVFTSRGEALDYDYLVLCCGVTANFFDVAGAEAHARTIYSRKAALEVRDTVFANIEEVAQGRADASEPVIVIVGAGATGVEMAGTLAEMRNSTLPRLYPEVDIDRVRVVLVEMGDEVLAPFSPRLRKYAAEELRARGVELRLGTAVTEVREDCVVLSDGEQVPSAVTIWASGVEVSDDVSGWDLPQGRGGRVKVEVDMRVCGHPEIFAVGDLGICEDAPLPQLAQPAIQGGRHAGTQIRRLIEGLPTQPMRYRDKGTMAAIGKSDAIVQLPNGWSLTGRPAWLVWVAVHIAMLAGNRNRLATLVNLSVRYLARPGQLNVIVGDPP